MAWPWSKPEVTKPAAMAISNQPRDGAFFCTTPGHKQKTASPETQISHAAGPKRTSKPHSVARKRSRRRQLIHPGVPNRIGYKVNNFNLSLLASEGVELRLLTIISRTLMRLLAYEDVYPCRRRNGKIVVISKGKPEHYETDKTHARIRLVAFCLFHTGLNPGYLVRQSRTAPAPPARFSHK